MKLGKLVDRRDFVIWPAFVCASVANVLTIGFLDSWRQSRKGMVSDGGIQFLDVVGVLLLGITLVGLRLRSRRNVTLLSAVVCSALPGILAFLYLFVF